jgi:hypothetical protein
MAVKIQLRRGTAAQWTSANPTLSEGEFGLETDTLNAKIGDGLTAWNSLAYFVDVPTITSALALKQNLVNTEVALVDAASMDLTAIKHTLSSSSATRTFTISYTGDDITLVVTLSAVSATYTFPATSLCVSEGVASGDNTLALAGSSGDKYIIGIKKIGSAYYVVSKNFGQ